jgi:hypothetical protein
MPWLTVVLSFSLVERCCVQIKWETALMGTPTKLSGARLIMASISGVLTTPANLLMKSFGAFAKKPEAEHSEPVWTAANVSPQIYAMLIAVSPHSPTVLRKTADFLCEIRPPGCFHFSHRNFLL